MNVKNKKRQVVKISVFITSLFVIFLSVTYAFINMTLVGTKRQVITAGNLSLELQEDENNLTIQDAMPMYDEVGMIQKAFTFRLVNKTSTDTNYVLKLVDITIGQRLDTSIVKYELIKDGVESINFISRLRSNRLDSGKINGNQTIEYSLRLWIDSSVEENEVITGKSLSYRIDVEVEQNRMKKVYQETLLNGCDPILSDNLVPITIEEDGTVKKADIKEEWYKYEEKKWANAVVLEDKTIEYTEGQVISEENIQSYFVWIPRYKYKLFDMGNYDSRVETVEKKEQIIDIIFESKEVTPSVGKKVGDYHSHPAFQAFDSNGFWVGKFESGYKGAATPIDAQQNNYNSANLVIKPNVYSWRGITIGNAFKASYDYLREDESHMMKNTEWGAVAYLQHSEYGSHTSVRVNNNNSYKTGYAAVKEPTKFTDESIEGNEFGTDPLITQAYNTEVGYTASTTGNITDIYDMSGGTWEAVMGYNTEATTIGGKSMITDNYEDFFTNEKWNKYYDQYSSISDTSYNSRILGDATGEMGPFTIMTANKLNWYGDYGYFLTTSTPWFMRGGRWNRGTAGGIFAFYNYLGQGDQIAFRTILVI